MQSQTYDLKIESNLNKQYFDEDQNVTNQLVYKNFATKPTESFLGISIQKERLYVIQKKSIGVFQYFRSVESSEMPKRGPVMIKQIFLPFEISKYYITQRYICVKSKSKTQIRDSEFEKVYYSENKGIILTRSKEVNEGYNDNFAFDTVEQLELQCEIQGDEMISWKVITKRKSTEQKYLRQYWSERFNILTKHKSIIKCRSQMIDPTLKNRKLEIFKPPLFINQLGYIQNFYIWPTSSSEMQIGIFFNQKQSKNVTENALYEICSFQLKETNIKNVFYYDFKANTTNGKNKDGPHLFLSVCENLSKQNSKIKILIFQILPEQSISHEESQNEALNNYLDQFNQLQKQKKSQQSISNSLLLNELLSNQQKSESKSNPNQPTTIMESFTIKNSGNLKKVFFNPKSKVLWINDSSDMVYRIKLSECGDIKQIRQNNLSFIENLEGYQNGEVGPDLQGVMYDDFPIFKVKAFALEMGLRREQSSLRNMKNENDHNSEVVAEICYEKQKQVFQFDDKTLQQFQNQKNHQNQQKDDSSSKEFDSIQIQTDQFQKQCLNNSTQTQESKQQNGKQIEKTQEKKISINNLSELLQQLNFNKVQDVLIRFSTIFTGQITKNVNKLKDFNQKAKDQIKLKITGEIFQLLKEVFSTLMNDSLSQKIQNEVAKARQFVEKLFNKQIEHFNLMILQQKVKEENIKKYILEEQLRSMDIIKQASMKFLDVTKVRQMQKVAYNQIILENIKEVGRQIQSLKDRVEQMFKQSQQIEKKIISEVTEIKETFKLLVQLEENESEEEEEVKIEEESSDQGFLSSQDEDEQRERMKQVHQQKRKYPYQQGYQYQPPRIPPQGQYPPNWGQNFYQGPVKYPYPSYPGSSVAVNAPPNYPPFYQTFPHSYHQPQPNPYMNPVNPPQPQHYFPPPNFYQHSFGQTSHGSIKKTDPVINDKKKKPKASSKLSAALKNE